MTGWAMLGLEAAGNQPARSARRWRDAGFVPARPGRPAALGRRSRAHDPGSGRGRRRTPHRFAGERPRRRPARQARRRRFGRRPGQPHRVLRAGDARRRARTRVAEALGEVAALRPELRRGLGDPAEGALGVRFDRRRAPGADRGGRGRQGGGQRRALVAPSPAARGWLGARLERRRQLAVDRVGGPGAGRGRLGRWRGRRRAALPGGAQAPDGHYRYSASSDQTPIWVTRRSCSRPSARRFHLRRRPQAEAATAVRLGRGSQGGRRRVWLGRGRDRRIDPGSTERAPAARPAVATAATQRARTGTAGGGGPAIRLGQYRGAGRVDDHQRRDPGRSPRADASSVRRRRRNTTTTRRHLADRRLHSARGGARWRLSWYRRRLP